MSDTAPANPVLHIQNLSFTYTGENREKIRIFNNFNLKLAAKEILAIQGPSGCGKTSLLRIIAGLEHEYTGSILWKGAPIDRIPAHRRGFAMVFQDGLLFEHKTVAQNIAYGMRVQKVAKSEQKRRTTELLELAQLAGYENRSVNRLSGGQRQRVALLRALAVRPQLLLLDEPLSALDQDLRETLAISIREILKETGTTALFITHDRREAHTVSDRLLHLPSPLANEIR